MARTTSQGLVVYETGEPSTVIATGMPTGDSVDAAIASVRGLGAGAEAAATSAATAMCRVG
jgi:hypothetical protein